MSQTLCAAFSNIHSLTNRYLYNQILESSIAEYNNDLHASNMVGMSILVRHGGSDDNVPPYHSRKYARLVNEHSHDITAATYVNLYILKFKNNTSFLIK
jgi:hypothetical protein